MPAEFGAKAAGEADPELVTIAETIIERRLGAFEPTSFRDRYQDALRELVEAKTKGLATAPHTIAEPPKVINLMEALKLSLAQDPELESKKAAAANPRARRPSLTEGKGRGCYPYQGVAGRRT